MRNVNVNSIITGAAGILNTRIIVNPNKSRGLQEALFANGWKWRSGDTNISHTTARYLYLGSDKTLTFGTKNYTEHFKASDLERIAVTL